jgi:hypothetical protein
MAARATRSTTKFVLLIWELLRFQSKAFSIGSPFNKTPDQNDF